MGELSSTILWTEALVSQEGVSPAEVLLSLLLLTWAQLASLLARLVHQARDSLPLDPKVVRTPLAQFSLPKALGYTFPSHFFQPRGQPRMHYLQEGQADAPRALLLLHGEPFWSQAWVKVLPALSRENRVVVPDMVGFGLSDKWVDWRQYSLARHADSLLQLVEHLGLGREGQEVVLVGHNWGWMVGAEMARRRPGLFSRLVILNTNNLPDGEAELARFSSSLGWAKFQVMNSWFLAFRASMDLLREHFPLSLLLHSLNTRYTKSEVSAFLAPWPSPQYRGGTTSFPLLVPVLPSHPEAPAMARIRTFLNSWHRPVLVMYSQAALLPFLKTGDFVVGNRPSFYKSLIPGMRRIIRVEDSGHLVQYDQPALVVSNIRAFLAETGTDSGHLTGHQNLAT